MVDGLEALLSVLALPVAGLAALPTAEETGDALLSLRALQETGTEALLSVLALPVARLEVLPTAEETGDAQLSVRALQEAGFDTLPAAEETGDALLSVRALPVAGLEVLPTVEETGDALLSIMALPVAGVEVLPTAEETGDALLSVLALQEARFDALLSVLALSVDGTEVLPTAEETVVRGESEVAFALDGWPGRERYGAERSTIFTEGSIGKNGLRPLRRRTTIETSWPLDARRFALTESTLSIPPELWSPLMQYIIFISAKIMLLFFTTAVRHCFRNHSRELRAFICRLRYGEGARP